jgi:NRDE-2, necessary for RNA interference
MTRGLAASHSGGKPQVQAVAEESEVRQRWNKVLDRHPGSLRLWREYFAYRLASFPAFSTSKQRYAYEDALEACPPLPLFACRARAPRPAVLPWATAEPALEACPPLALCACRPRAPQPAVLPLAAEPARLNACASWSPWRSAGTVPAGRVRLAALAVGWSAGRPHCGGRVVHGSTS